MSNVTNLILSFSIVEDEMNRVTEVNFFSNNGQKFNIVSADFEEKLNGRRKEKRWYGGSKNLETPLYVGAFNNLDLESLIIHLKDIDWIEPENVQLIIKEQQSNKFRIIEITPAD